jgi:hypothetical protein
MLSVQTAENVYTGTKNATALAPSPPIFIIGGNSRAARAGTAKMHLNHSLRKKIRRACGPQNSALTPPVDDATNLSCRAFAGRFRGLLMACRNGKRPRASEIRCLWPEYNTLGSVAAVQLAIF